VTGYSRDEVIGLNIADIVAPDHVELARSMIQRKLDEQVPTTYELDIVSKFGRRSTIEVNSQLIYQRREADRRPGHRQRRHGTAAGGVGTACSGTETGSGGAAWSARSCQH
jgi:PAS domain-containing protein